MFDKQIQQNQKQIKIKTKIKVKKLKTKDVIVMHPALSINKMICVEKYKWTLYDLVIICMYIFMDNTNTKLLDELVD